MKEQHGLPASGQQLHHFSNYDLIRRIDVGGMGEVYLAHQRTAFNRKVAIKIIRSDLVHDTIARKRFLREAEVSAHLKHEHILPLFEFGEEQGRLFMVTPYIEGGTLARRLQSGPFSLVETHQLFTALVQAIAYIHKRGVIHRDLKPNNILLDKAEDSEQVYVRLIDFGIASLQGKAVNPQMTIGGQEMGTIAYLAPERLDGIAAPSNDIYSLGVILYQMLTGELPSVTSQFTLPPALDTLIRRTTATNPADRYATADELLKAFEGTYRYLNSIRDVNLPVVAQQPEVEIENDPTPGRIVHTPHPQEVDSQPIEQQTGGYPITPARQKTGAQPVEQQAGGYPVTPARQKTGAQPAIAARQSSPAQPTSQRGANTTSRHITGSKPALAPRQNSNTQSGPSSTFTKPRVSSEMPALPLRQPAVARASTMKSMSGEVEAIQPEQRLTKRAGMRVHTQDQPDFSRQDYDAPTSSLDPAMLARKQANLKNEAALTSQPISKPLAVIAAKRPTRTILALIPISIILLLLVVGGLSYIMFQAGITASVSLTPQVHSMSQTFTITAKPEQTSIDENAAIIPASALSSSKTGSLPGATSGVTNCQLFGILNCQKAVSPFDVNFLATQLKPSLQKLIANDLQNQSGNSGKQLIGSIIYNDDNITSNPGVGSASKTVTVSLTEKGSVEYFQKSDAQKLAGQLLQKQITKKFGAQYRLIDQYTQVSIASVQNIDNNGVVTISIAAGGIASYQMSTDELNRIQSHIEGLTVKAARTYIAKIVGINPATVIVSLSAGEKIPTNGQKVTITMQAPNVTGLLPVNMPKIKPGIPFSPPA